MTVRLPVVEVVWEDSAHGMTSWHSRVDAVDDARTQRVRSAGYLVADTDAGVVLCVSHDGNVDDVAGCIVIPRSAIRSRRTLRA
jgi:hypothetical protein